MIFPHPQNIRRTCGLCVVGLCLLAGLNTAAAEKTTEQKAAVQSVATIAAFRLAAMQGQNAAFKRLLTSGAFAAWQKQIALMDPQSAPRGVADFINTAVLLVGPQTQDDGLCALYSPFQDVILLIKTDNSESFSQVENFRFLPGAVFRGETLSETPPPSLIPGKGVPLTIALMKVFAETEKVFNRIAATTSPLAKFPAATEAQTRWIEKVMDTRNLCALTLLKEEHRESFYLATIVRACLKDATAAELQARLQPGAYQEQAASFAALPAEIRSGMELCHYLSSPERDLYAFMNKLFPRYIAIVTADLKEENAKWTLEWFDIGNAKDLYPLYEKELAKNRK